MAITPLPSAPLITDTPAEFNTKAFAWVGALDDFTTEANQLASDVSADEASAAASAATASQAAQVAAGAVNFQGAYDNGTTYQIGESVVYNNKIYIAKVVTVGVLPTNTTNWFVLENGDVTTDGVQTLTNKTIEDPIITLNGSEGTSGQVLTSQGDNLEPVWKSIDGTSDTYTASGSITAGNPISLNSDGTVSVSGLVYKTNLGTKNAITNDVTDTVRVYHMGSNNFVMTYCNSGTNYPTYRTGTLSGNSITFGSAITLLSQSSTKCRFASNSSTQGVFLYRTLVSGSYNGYYNRFTFPNSTVGGQLVGSAGDFINDSCDIAYSVTNSAYVIFYDRYADRNRWLPTSTFTLSTEYTGPNQGYAYYAISANPSWQSSCGAVLAYIFSSNIYVFRTQGIGSGFVGDIANAGTITGHDPIVAYDTKNEKIITAYTQSSPAGTYFHVRGSGGEVRHQMSSNVYSLRGLSFDSVSGFVSFAYKNNTTNIGYIDVYDFSSNTLTLISSTEFDSAVSTQLTCASGSTGNTVIVYRDSSTGQLASRPFQSAENTVSNWFGFASSSASTGEQVTVQHIGGINKNQSGLTRNTTYYLNASTGALTTSSSGNIKVGKALSTTSLLISEANTA